MNRSTVLDSYVWVRKDVLKEIRSGNNLSKNWKPCGTTTQTSTRKRGRDSWQWIRAKLCATTLKQQERKDLATSPYGQVRLRRVSANDSGNATSSSPIAQHHVTILVDDPEAGHELQNQKFSFETSPEEPLILMANTWWHTGAAAPQDLTSLSHLHEPAVVYCLRKRYEADLIYTYTGRILLALNPFRQIQSLYGQQVIEKYRQDSSSVQDRPPHVYATAQDAYSAMLREGQNQSILVSGESGAGKTVTTKIILGYLTTLSKWKVIESAGETTGGIESQVVHSNPILESFGNARTLRNDNSSRFGKFIDVRFQCNGHLKSASIQTYLLEKVRLIAPGQGERNFHIFYELLAGLSHRERDEVGLGNARGPEDFCMTAVSGMFDRRDGVEDLKTYRDLRTALTSIKMADNDQQQLFSVCCALLHSSNLSFIESSAGASEIDSSNPSLRAALNLFGVSLEAFGQSLCCTAIEARGEVFYKTLSTAQATKALEALIKATYSAMFQTIVNWINLSIAKSDHRENAKQDLSIGVFDIFGFESFDVNSFEQLCINFCNEALQQQFNQYVFKQEQAEYQREGIEWSFMSFPDNQDVLDLIEKKHEGILSILDEQNLIPRCTDQSFARAIYEKCADHPRFSVECSQKIAGTFCIEHYAGIVEYNTTSFLEKNKDELPKETTELLKSSSISFIAGLGADLAKSRSASSNGEGRRVFRRPNSSLVKESVGSQFTRQLRELRAKIEKTAPHYIRCLKPNDLLVPGSFSSVIIADQLRCAGVLEAIRVSRVGFSQRYPHQEFIRRYQMLARGHVPKHRRFYSEKDLCEVVVNAIVVLIRSSIATTVSEHKSPQGMQRSDSEDKLGIQMGRSKVFLRRFAFECLEMLRHQLLGKAATTIQARGRTIIARNRFLSASYSALVLQRWARRLPAARLASAARQHRCATKIQSQWRGFVAERYFFAALFISMWCQRSYRGMVAREIYACILLELKIEMIQRTWRQFRRRRRHQSYACAATKIQLKVRSNQARVKVRELRSEARNVNLIKQQRDIFREESLRLRREVLSPKEQLPLTRDAESLEVLRLKNEIAALKSQLFGLEVTPASTPETKERGNSGIYRHVIPSHAISPDVRLLPRSELQFSPNVHGNPSVVSDSSILSRSILEDVDEEEGEVDPSWESPSPAASPSSAHGIIALEIDCNHEVRRNVQLTPISARSHVMATSMRGPLLRTPFREQVSAFHQAIALGDEVLTSSILDRSEYCHLLVNEPNAIGKSPLHIAASLANFALVQTLLDYGAAANCQDIDGNTPLHMCTNVDVTGLLLLTGMANPNIPNNAGYCALHVAVSRLDIASVQFLLRCHADVNVADDAHWLTPLHLLTSGTDFSGTVKNSGHQRRKIANLLCEVKSPVPTDVDFQDKNGNTPLHNIAILEIEEACVLLQILLENGAQPNLANLRGQTPLHLLCHNDSLRDLGVMQEMLYNMLYHGAEPNIPSQSGCTALHLSLYHRDIDSAVQLMRRGSELHLLWNKPKRWTSFWEEMGTTDVLALDMVSDENSLHRLLAAISRPQKWAPNRPWCMHCKTMLGSFARSLHCRHCGRLVCGACSQQSLTPDYFPKSFEIYENSWVCIVCEQILISRKDGEVEIHPSTSSINEGTATSQSSF
ncbi:myosin-kinesin ATPase superfamily-like protein [Fragilaria crotonensis]|nr:myosin-kinesin ATPase superfamily-like protein [Fragilaria crotonensis]